MQSSVSFPLEEEAKKSCGLFLSSSFQPGWINLAHEAAKGKYVIINMMVKIVCVSILECKLERHGVRITALMLKRSYVLPTEIPLLGYLGSYFIS